MRRVVVCLAACSLMHGGFVVAQESAPAGANAPAAVALGLSQPKGSVTGHVYLNDTNGPARFARVILKPVPNAATDAANSKDGDDMMSAMTSLFGVDKDEKKKSGSSAAAAASASTKPKKPADADEKAGAAVMAQLASAMSDLNHSATVSADGSYTITGVKPGTYYVHALLSGYVDPLKGIPPAELGSTDAVVQQRVRSQVTTVTVNGDEAAHAELKLQRGAAINGRVTYDDGSPAVGWDVTVIRVMKATDGTVTTSGDGSVPDVMDSIAKITHTTDDRGEYRLASLAGGEYIVKATLTTSNASAGGLIGGGALKLTVLSGNVLHQSDATTVSVGESEERGDVNLVMPLSKLHSISGRVSAKSDAAPVNAGSVVLEEDGADPNAILRAQAASIQDDGTFRFDYIANGHYVLKIRGAKITEKTGKTTKLFGMDIPDDTTLRSFAKSEQKLDVSDADVSGVSFVLGDEPVKKKK